MSEGGENSEPEDGEESEPEGGEAMSYSPPSSPDYRPSSPTMVEDKLIEELIPAGSLEDIKAEPMDSTGVEVVSVVPGLSQLREQVRSRDKKLKRAKAIIRSLQHNVAKRSQLKCKLSKLQDVIHDQQESFDFEISALRAQLLDLERGKAKMVDVANTLTVKSTRLSEECRLLNADLIRLKAVNLQFSHRFAARPQY